MFGCGLDLGCIGTNVYVLFCLHTRAEFKNHFNSHGATQHQHCGVVARFSAEMLKHGCCLIRAADESDEASVEAIASTEDAIRTDHQ